MRSSMSCDQPAPRIRMRLPLTRNRRLPLVGEFRSDLADSESTLAHRYVALSGEAHREALQMRLAHLVGPPELRIVDAQGRKLLRAKRPRSGPHARASSTGCSKLTPAAVPGDHALHRDRSRCASSAYTVRSAVLSVSSRKCVTASGERSVTGPVATRSTAPHRPMSLSGGQGFQSTQLMPRSFSVGANVSTASTFVLPGFSKLGHIEVVGAIGSGHWLTIRDLVAVQPDFGAIVDAAKVQPEARILAVRRGRRELRAIPPAAVVGTVGRHGQVGKILPDGIGRAGNLAQIVAEVRIGNDAPAAACAASTVLGTEVFSQPSTGNPAEAIESPRPGVCRPTAAAIRREEALRFQPEEPVAAQAERGDKTRTFSS